MRLSNIICSHALAIWTPDSTVQNLKFEQFLQSNLDDIFWNWATFNNLIINISSHVIFTFSVYPLVSYLSTYEIFCRKFNFCQVDRYLCTLLTTSINKRFLVLFLIIAQANILKIFFCPISYGRECALLSCYKYTDQCK